MRWLATKLAQWRARRRFKLPMMPKKVIRAVYGLEPGPWEWVPFFGYRRLRKRARNLWQELRR